MEKSVFLWLNFFYALIEDPLMKDLDFHVCDEDGEQTPFFFFANRVMQFGHVALCECYC
jgi:hypothetical protein